MSCKGGVQRRRRSCNNPSPAHGGKNCIGVSTVTRACNNGPCPGIVIVKQERSGGRKKGGMDRRKEREREGEWVGGISLLFGLLIYF